MPILLRPETEKLIEERMKLGRFSTPDDVIQMALQTLESFDPAELDEGTTQAIDRAEAEYARGEGMPLDQAIAKLKQKHFGA